MGMDKLKPVPADIFTDEDLTDLEPEVKVTAIGLHMHADDQGRESTTLWRLRAAIWPNRPQITDDLLVTHLLTLDELGYIGIYTAGERTYYQRRVWPKPSHPLPSKFPEPPLDLFQRFAGSNPADRSAWERESKESSERGEERTGQRPAGLPPNPFCKVHRPAGSGGIPCHHCQDARLAHNQFVREQSLAAEGRAADS